MATFKRTAPAKVTVETDDRTITLLSTYVNIGKSSWGGWEDMTIHSPYDIQVKHNEKEAPVTDTSPTITSVDDANKQAAVKALKVAAQQIERVTLANARDIERAIASAQSTADSADHQLNMTVLEALHSGITAQELQDILTHLGFPQLTDRVDDVFMLAVDDLYVTEA